MAQPINAAKEHILQIYQAKRKVASYDLANGINVIVDALVGRLPYEFIQNADDASETNQGFLSFTLRGNVLIISHNGKHFTENDVTKICAVAQQEFRDKIEDHEMIGQKGIGIKVAFSEADQMIIYSRNYCFRFQKDYKEWKSATREKPYPWQITPIWTENSERPSDLDPEKVHFILTLRNPKNIEEQLKELAAYPTVLLFLNRIRRLSILGTELLMEVTLSSERKIYKNGELHSRWIFQRDPVVIPPKIRDVLKKMDHTSCPDKLKTAETLKLFFAYRIDDKGVVEAKDTVLSCYLPTVERCHLPFLVNGDFLLEPSRERLKVNDWNGFVLEQVAIRHFHWLEWMASKAHLRQGILNVLGPSQLIGLDPRLIERYGAAYRDCIAKTQFIPSQQNPNRLLCVPSCYLDLTGFFRAFYGKNLVDPNLEHLVDDQLDNLNSILSSVKTLNYDYIITNSTRYLQYHPDLILPYLEFFKEHWDNIFYFHSKFRQECMLPNGYGSLSPISGFYLTSDNTTSYPPCLKIPLIPQECQTPSLKKWLSEKVGIKYLSRKEIIHGPLSTFVKSSQVNRDNTISIMRFLYSALCSGEIREYDLTHAFSKMKVLTIQGEMRLTSECYLSNAYDPTFKLENLIPDRTDFFISVLYMTSGDDIQVWKRLFLCLEATDQITVKYPPHPQISELQSRNAAYVKEYLDYLYRNPETSPVRKIDNNGSHTLPNFVYIPFMNLLHIHSYAHHFWREILQNWNTVYSLCSKPQYKTQNQSAKPLEISYIQFIIQEMHLCSNRGLPVKGKELYASHLTELIGGWLDTVDIPYPMSLEQTLFFGFKTKVHPLHCLDIFDKMRSSGKTDIPKYADLLKHLSDGYPLLKKDEQLAFQRRQKFVIVEDGSWQPSALVKCSLIPGANQRFDRVDRVKLVLSLEEMEALSKIMGFGTITQVPIIVPEAEEDKKLSEDLRKKLPLIALCEGLNTQKDGMTILKQLVPRIDQLKIYHAPKISLSTDNGDLTDTLLIENSLYYRLRCPEKKRKIGLELCKYFHLSSSMEQLLPEILSLTEAAITGKTKNIQEFLKEKGIRSELLDKLQEVDFKQTFQNQEKKEEKVPEPTIIPLPPKEIKPPVNELPPPPEQPLVETTPFMPAIAPEDIDFDEIVVQKELEERKTDITTHQGPPRAGGAKGQRTKKTVQDTKPIGDWGEEVIFNFFIHKFENHNTPKNKTKLQLIKTEKNNNTVDFHCVNGKGENLTIKLTWLNMNKDAFKPRDLELTWFRGNEIVKKRFIEVKTSLEPKVHFYLSGNEYEFMKKNLPDFRIYHVGDAKTETPKMTKIKNIFTFQIRVINSIEFVA